LSAQLRSSAGENVQRVVDDHRANSLFVGKPVAAHVPKFRGPNSTRGSPAAAAQCVSRSWDGTNAVSMAYLDEGICYFTYLAGDFAPIDDKGSGSNTSSKGIRAQARCYLYNQSQ
jgi:hypothetical protein